jgi:hypothetical protein
MAKLSKFKIIAGAILAGAWVRVGDDFDDMEIQTRGYTDAFNDARAANLRKAAQYAYGGDVSRIPGARFREINAECIIEYCLIDVRNVSNDDGTPMTFADFCDALRDPAYQEIYVAVLRAIGMVGYIKATDVETATGN